MTTYDNSYAGRAAAAFDDKSLKLAEQGGPERFKHFGNAPRSESELTIESIRERVDSTSEVLERILHRSVAPARWGTNE